MDITLWNLQGCLDLMLCLFHLLGMAFIEFAVRKPQQPHGLVFLH